LNEPWIVNYAYSGLVYNIADGYDEVSGGPNPNNLTPRPNYVAGCNINEGANVDQWFNPNCFTLQLLARSATSGGIQAAVRTLRTLRLRSSRIRNWVRV
jgi:hypothetical protein